MDPTRTGTACQPPSVRHAAILMDYQASSFSIEESLQLEFYLNGYGVRALSEAHTLLVELFNNPGSQPFSPTLGVTFEQFLRLPSLARLAVSHNHILLLAAYDHRFTVTDITDEVAIYHRFLPTGLPGKVNPAHFGTWVRPLVLPAGAPPPLSRFRPLEYPPTFDVTTILPPVAIPERHHLHRPP